mmetsp:Transcript_23915/g.80305  ORF Transcript_23915/g.80305 Transcript_23915/m.80305 type:complete len:228 (+) Transcript_23915:893-1576(+)
MGRRRRRRGGQPHRELPPAPARGRAPRHPRSDARHPRGVHHARRVCGLARARCVPRGPQLLLGAGGGPLVALSGAAHRQLAGALLLRRHGGLCDSGTLHDGPPAVRPGHAHPGRVRHPGQGLAGGGRGRQPRADGRRGDGHDGPRRVRLPRCPVLEIDHPQPCTASARPRLGARASRGRAQPCDGRRVLLGMRPHQPPVCAPRKVRCWPRATSGGAPGRVVRTCVHR